MAACRHLACSNCWSQWLPKSSTCPKCRATVTKEQLTRVVFNTESAGMKAASLSQICRSSTTVKDDESSEEELEVVGSQVDFGLTTE